MAGPLVQAAKNALGVEVNEDFVDEVRDESKIGTVREELNDRIDGGGCCNAMEAANAIREEGNEYRN